MAFLQDQQPPSKDRFRQAAERSSAAYPWVTFLIIAVLLIAVFVLISQFVYRPSGSQPTRYQEELARKLAAELNQDVNAVLPQTLGAVQAQTPADSFSLFMTPDSKALQPGNDVEYDVYVVRGKEFQGQVTLRAQNVPEGVTATLADTTVTGSSTGRTKIRFVVPKGTPYGSYAFQIVGSSGGAEHAATATLIVTNLAMTNIRMQDIRPSPEGTRWQATVTWETSVPANSWVEFTPQADYTNQRQSYAFTAANDEVTAQHSMTLAALAPDTVYHYRIKSVDSLNNLIVSEDHFFITAVEQTK